MREMMRFPGRSRTRLKNGLLQRFARCEEGNFIIMAALILPVLLGASALAVEYGAGLVSRANNQRVADMAAFSAALRYTVSPSEAEMSAAARNIARINRINPDNVAVALVTSPRGEGDAVHVTVTTQNSIILGTILGASPLLSVSAEAYAALGEVQTVACLLALDPAQSGVTMAGGTNLAARDCTVASNASLNVPCGTTITAQAVAYNGASPNQPCNGIRGSDGGPARIVKEFTPDPLAGHGAIRNAANRLSTVAAMTAVTIPTATAGQDLVFSWGNQSNIASHVAATGCSLAGTAPTWTVNCPDSVATHHFGSMTVSDNITVSFNTGTSLAKTYMFSGGITVSGSAIVNFPNGNYLISRGINTSGGTRTSFGKGNFIIGPNTTGCHYGSLGRHSICASAELTIDGPSSFTLAAGFHSGTSNLQLGAGTTNRFDIGAANDGNAIAISGGARAIMADALGAADSFRVRGHINANGGGSCFLVSAAQQHDIAGSFLAGGGVILGAGTYTVDGVMLFGSAGGGATYCYGRMVSFEAQGVTLVVSGKPSPYSTGSCANMAFCVSAGYSNMIVQAPASGPLAGVSFVGPLTGRTEGATLAQGASNARISGAFYLPTGPIIMGGGAGVSGGGGGCLQLVGSRIDLSGGAAAASDCLGGTAGGSSGMVFLVQ